MTAKRRKGSVANNLVRKPLCKLMLSCDGNTLTGNRREAGFCGKCAETLAKRAKPTPPLRGENTALYEALRRPNTDDTRDWDANGTPVEA